MHGINLQGKRVTQRGDCDSTTNSLLSTHRDKAGREEEEEEDYEDRCFQFGASSSSNPSAAVELCPTSHVAGKFSICDDDEEEEGNDISICMPSTDSALMENALPLSLSQNNSERKQPGSIGRKGKNKNSNSKRADDKEEEEGEVSGVVPRLPSQTTALQRREDTRP